ncbi:hypothetical protein Gotur_019381, partial [Gossypium turneri]
MLFMFFLVGKVLLLMDGFFEMPLGYQPSAPEEFFNMKHASARNVIERCFGLLKLRWGILRSPSFYPVRVHNGINIA